MISAEALERIRASQEWKEIKTHIIQHLKVLDSVSDIKISSPDEMAAEVIGRQKAKRVLEEILRPIIGDNNQRQADIEAMKARTGLA